jgi:nitrite reductase/ring-hydroxylating ferredoxin subunit
MPDHEIIAPGSGPAVPHVGGYRRVLPVSLERMYENVLDWAHLPFVHSSTFSSVRCEDYGSWGWRGRVSDRSGQAWRLEVRLDRRCRRWITRTLDGEHAGAEIWTHAAQLAAPGAVPRLQIVVDFFVPGVPEQARNSVARAYARLYERLYDEDVGMMCERQAQLDRRVEKLSSLALTLGPREGLELPQVVVLGAREFVLAEFRDTLVAYPARCPHQLGPLGSARLVDGEVRCPWHGYRFDVLTGECVSGQTCQLQPMPRVNIGPDGQVSVHIPT